MTCYIVYDHPVPSSATETLRISYGNRTVIVQSSRNLHFRPEITQCPCDVLGEVSRNQYADLNQQASQAIRDSWGQSVYHLLEHGWLNAEQDLEVTLRLSHQH